MFTYFFYHLRKAGIPVSFNEWNALIDALEMGLAGSSLTGFYNLCRAVLVKSETYFDRFDLAFVQFFEGVETPEQISEDIWNWLDKHLPPKNITEEMLRAHKRLSLEELEKMLEERLKEQDEEHHGGNYWVGTGGTSPFGHSGFHPGGIRIGGESRNLSAVKVAGKRKYKEYRDDETLGTRQFQLALKKLRHLTTRTDGMKTELDLDETINQTCKNAGRLELVWDRPRENGIKVLLLMDAGGSMHYYNRLCSQLFTAVNRSAHFKDLKMFYFHNCIYDHLYLDPSCYENNAIDTEYILHTYESDYRVIIVGDASMGPYELMSPGGIIYWGMHNDRPGIEWLRRIKSKFEYSIWLNPINKDYWMRSRGYFSIRKIADIFPMDELTVSGLERGIGHLKSKRQT